MAFLNTIRSKSPKYFIIAIMSVFIILLVFDWGMDCSGRKNRGGNDKPLGKVNGKEISYQYFSEVLRQTEEAQKRQQGSDLDEETIRNLRSFVWNQIVEEMLVDQELERLNIKATDEEIKDMLLSSTPPEYIAQYFKDSTGRFNEEFYRQTISNPKAKDFWINVEQYAKKDIKQKKLHSILLASVNVSESEMLQKFKDKTVSMNAEYVLFDLARMIPDSAVKIDEDDIKEQYKKRASEFKTKESRKIKYVVFKQTASAQDTSDVIAEANRLIEQSKNIDFKELATTYSESPVTDAFFKRGDLSKIKETAIFNAKVGQVVGPIIDNDGVHLIKIAEQQQSKQEVVKASHILFNMVDGPDTINVIKKAKQVLARAKAGEDFAKLAKEFSQDYGSGMEGGELGWGTTDRYVKPFADALKKMRVGEVSGLIRTQFGWHIVKLSAKDNKEVRVVDLLLKIKPSTRTIDKVLQDAEEFSDIAKVEGFEKAAENSKYQVVESPEFNRNSGVPGLGQNDVITSFAFKNKVGKISQPINISNGVAVIMVSAEREEGIRPMEEIKTSLESSAIKDKKFEMIKSQVDEFYKSLTANSDLIAAAQQNPKLFSGKTNYFRASDYIPGVGTEPAFFGTAYSLQPNQLSKPFKGMRGYYIIKLLSKTEVDTVRYNVERESLKKEILQDKQKKFMTNWKTLLLDNAKIEDNRDLYYR